MCGARAWAMKSSRFLKRKVPALVMRLTRKCPGYSMGGSRRHVRARRGPVARRGRPAAQKLVRSLVVVLRAEVD